jgi:hypothetical protein
MEEQKKKMSAGKIIGVIFVILIFTVPAWMMLNSGNGTPTTTQNCDSFYNFKRENATDQQLESISCLRQAKHWGFAKFDSCTAEGTISIDAIKSDPEYAPEVAANYTLAVKCVCCQKAN